MADTHNYTRFLTLNSNPFYTPADEWFDSLPQWKRIRIVVTALLVFPFVLMAVIVERFVESAYQHRNDK